MDLQLQNRRAAVAAATAGLGFAAARALVAEGVTVAVCGRDRARTEAAAERLGYGSVPVPADVSTPQGAEDFVRSAFNALGGLDILVTNAGGPPAATFATATLSDYERAVAMNLLSVVAMCTAAVPAMRSQGWGRIVAITSITVRQPIANLITSTTARAGATGFLKTLATEVAGHGITVNSVQPGYHATERVRSLLGDETAALAASIPTGTVGDPNDFGAVVAFLCSEQAKFLTGSAIPIDGGVAAGLQ